MEPKVKCPQCGHEFSVNADEKKIVKECKEFLYQTLNDQELSEKAKAELERIKDLIRRVEDL